MTTNLQKFILIQNLLKSILVKSTTVLIKNPIKIYYDQKLIFSKNLATIISYKIQQKHIFPKS